MIRALKDFCVIFDIVYDDHEWAIDYYARLRLAARRRVKNMDSRNERIEKRVKQLEEETK